MPFPLKPYTKDLYEDQTQRLLVLTVPTRSDNYTFFVVNKDKNKAILIDSADHKAVLKTLEQKNLELESILLTHHHFDHVDGLDVILSKHPKATLYCSKKEAQRGVFSAKSTTVEGGVTLDLFGESVQVIETPGHTVSHLSYYFSESEALFCGDTLFSLGCGRVFEKENDIFKRYFNSLERLTKTVSAQTKIFCAHEYTETNLKFCEKENLVGSNARVDLEKRLIINKNERTVPSDFSFELMHNPFLKASSPQELKKLRSLKDAF